MGRGGGGGLTYTSHTWKIVPTFSGFNKSSTVTKLGFHFLPNPGMTAEAEKADGDDVAVIVAATLSD